MKRLIVSVTGKDKPGIIAYISGLLLKEGCNLEDVSMTILDGQFAMMMTASLSEKKKEKVRSALAAAEKSPWKMKVYMDFLAKSKTKGKTAHRSGRRFLFTAFGRDRTGIVHEASKLLAKKRINITDFNSRILGAGKKTLYGMMLEIETPLRSTPKAIEKILKPFGKKLKVEVNVREIETLNI